MKLDGSAVLQPGKRQSCCLKESVGFVAMWYSTGIYSELIRLLVIVFGS